jgi:hypothetical protein
MISIMNNFFNQSLLSDSYKFADSPIYKLPNNLDEEQFESLLELYPNVDDTFIFKMH